MSVALLVRLALPVGPAVCEKVTRLTITMVPIAESS
jgi:hypothetical protein